MLRIGILCMLVYVLCEGVCREGSNPIRTNNQGFACHYFMRRATLDKNEHHCVTLNPVPVAQPLVPLREGEHTDTVCVWGGGGGVDEEMMGLWVAADLGPRHTWVGRGPQRASTAPVCVDRGERCAVTHVCHPLQETALGVFGWRVCRTS